MALNPTVIVEPDSLGAWIGLAGVALGALLSTGATWLQRHGSDTKERRREVTAAADELLTATWSLEEMLDGLQASRRRNPDALSEWLPHLTALMERIHKADEAIARYGKEPLIHAADELCRAARKLEYTFGGEKDDERTDALFKARDAFSAEMRKRNTLTS